MIDWWLVINWLEVQRRSWCKTNKRYNIQQETIATVVTEAQDEFLSTNGDFMGHESFIDGNILKLNEQQSEQTPVKVFTDWSATASFQKTPNEHDETLSESQSRKKPGTRALIQWTRQETPEQKVQECRIRHNRNSHLCITSQ